MQWLCCKVCTLQKDMLEPINLFHVCQRYCAERHGRPHHCSDPAAAQGSAKGHGMEYRSVSLLPGHELM